MTNWRPGLIAGLLSGVAWATLMTAVSLSFYGPDLNYLKTLNSTQLNGSTPIQILNSYLEVNTITQFILGPIFGVLIGLLLVWIGIRFLTRQSYAVRGLVVASFFWIVYELTLGSAALLEIASSLAVSLFSGYLLGILYVRFTRDVETIQDPVPTK